MVSTAGDFVLRMGWLLTTFSSDQIRGRVSKLELLSGYLLIDLTSRYSVHGGGPLAFSQHT